METANFLFSPIPVSVVTHCCCSISMKGLDPSLWHPICRDIDCAWVWPFNLVYPCAAYPKSSLRNWTDSVSFCIYISERCLLIVTWQHQVQMEKRVPRSEKYAGEEDSSTTYQPEKHLGSLALSVHVQAIIVTSMFFSSCKKKSNTQLNCQVLEKTSPPSHLNDLIKGSAMSHRFQSRPRCLMELYVRNCTGTGEGRSIMPVLGSTAASFGKQGGK